MGLRSEMGLALAMLPPTACSDAGTYMCLCHVQLCKQSTVKVADEEEANPSILTATFLIWGPANHLSISCSAANILVLCSTEGRATVLPHFQGPSSLLPKISNALLVTVPDSIPHSHSTRLYSPKYRVRESGAETSRALEILRLTFCLLDHILDC